MNKEQQSRQPGILKRFVIAYLRGIDAVLRLVGTSAIIALLYGVLRFAIHVCVQTPFGEAAAATAFPVTALILTPILIRTGILAGGFEIPAIWRREEPVVQKEGPQE